MTAVRVSPGRDVEHRHHAVPRVHLRADGDHRQHQHPRRQVGATNTAHVTAY